MKIKNKNNLDKIQLELTHKELVLIKEALKEYKPGFFKEEDKYLDYLNNNLFDKNEFKNIEKIYLKKDKILLKISKFLTKNNVW